MDSEDRIKPIHTHKHAHGIEMFTHTTLSAHTAKTIVHMSAKNFTFSY